MTERQSSWRFCHKCQTMFFDGYPAKGACPAGSGHEAAGYEFLVPHDGPETPTDQANWKFCQKCSSLFFDGYPAKGTCPAGAGHEAAGYNFLLPHDIADTPTDQGNWKFCPKCNSLCYDGYSGKGSCAAGGGHEAVGYNFVIPHVDDTIHAFDTGPITSDLALGGSAHVVLSRSGSFTFSSHAHDSGFDNIHYALAAALVTPSGLAFTFQHQGAVEGTSAGLPFGTPTRDQDLVTPGFNPAITADWDHLPGAVLVGNLVGSDALVDGMKDALNQALATVGKTASAAVVALV